MNRYAKTALDYFRDYLPTRYSQIEDPERYFEELGQQIQFEITELTPRLAGEDLKGEGFLAKVGRLKAAEKQATERVMAELVYSQAPENEQENLPEETAEYYGDLHQTLQDIHDLTSAALAEPSDPEPGQNQDPQNPNR